MVRGKSGGKCYDQGILGHGGHNATKPTLSKPNGLLEQFPGIPLPQKHMDSRQLTGCLTLTW